MKGTDQFHIGVIVDDFDATLSQLTEMFGYEWSPPISVAMPVTLPDEEVTLDMRLTYSKTEPRVEVVQSIAGTLWVPAPGSGVHHAGYWSDDLLADAAILEAHGYAVEARGIQPDGSLTWAYHRNPSGIRVELVSRALQPGLEQWWSSE